MKNLRITLGIAAIAIGSFAAFSFAPANDPEPETGIFYRNPTNGSMGSPVEGTNLCQGSGPICSQEYVIETGVATGNHITYGVKP